MAEKLKIIPLGGLDEIGKNITVLEYGKDMIVVDCGVGFPEEEMYGVDLVIPDFSFRGDTGPEEGKTGACFRASILGRNH